ncbi:MAG: hypothetical protein IJ862_06400 [Selenomonadaceae bacterium]|nr:hypothetical protein [Selenomonadaceae bacterium]
MIDEKKLANAAMSDEELDNVAGGTCYEMADDSRFLNSLNGSFNRYGATRCFFSSSYGREKLKEAWLTVGIETKLSKSLSVNNEYYLDGKQITQEQARQHAMEVVGKQMTESDWKW